MVAEPLTTLAGYDSTLNAEDYYFDAERAWHAINFIEQACTHSKGKWARGADGKPGKLLLEHWQKCYVGMLFGWRHKVTGLRRYRGHFSLHAAV